MKIADKKLCMMSNCIYCEKSLPVMSLEPGPIWRKAVTLTSRLTGVDSSGNFFLTDHKKVNFFFQNFDFSGKKIVKILDLRSKLFSF